MRRRIKAMALLLALTLLAACANVGPSDFWTPTMEAENTCYTMAFSLLPEGAVFHDFIVRSEPVSGPVDMEGYVMVEGGQVDLRVRVGTDDPAEDLDGNNCYIDFLYDNTAGHVVAYRFSWKEGYGPEA